MSLATLLTLPVTITRRSIPDATHVDEDGNAIETETWATTVCELQQQQRAEFTDRGDVGADTWRLILLPGTEIDFADKVTVDGHDYELTGPPWVARNPRTGVDSHIEATVKRTTGAGIGVDS